jgi:hypothetical protein
MHASTKGKILYTCRRAHACFWMSCSGSYAMTARSFRELSCFISFPLSFALYYVLYRPFAHVPAPLRSPSPPPRRRRSSESRHSHSIEVMLDPSAPELIDYNDEYLAAAAAADDEAKYVPPSRVPVYDAHGRIVDYH